MKTLPWDLIQNFLVIAKAGSLSKAALELNTSQPTLSRQMAALEKHIESTLFDRSTQGLKLTEVGIKLIENSEAMQNNAEQFYRIASGENISLSGSIRISANEIIGLYYLPKIISQFNQKYPELTVEIEISNKETSLNKRDADIALRMFRPTQPDLITKRLADIELNFVASKNYLKRHREPKSLHDAIEHKLIGYDRNTLFIDAIKQLKWPFDASNFKNKTDFLPLQIELARQGAGITITHKNLLNRFSDLQVILTDVKIPAIEFWQVCHADVHHNRKIRVMMDFLSEKLS